MANPSKTNTTVTTFYGGDFGQWEVLSIHSIHGESLKHVQKIEIVEAGEQPHHQSALWELCGFSSNIRYTTRSEKNELDKNPSVLSKPENTYASLIPIKKSEAWWSMTQDERRQIFEESSGHIGYSMKYLSAISRKLYHCRDIGEEFDFLTWFEFAPAHSSLFDELVAYLRSTEEWKYVCREVDLRLIRTAIPANSPTIHFE